MEPLEQFEDKDFGICKILFRKQAKLENVCLFAGHTLSPFLPEYVYYYLQEIKKSHLSLIFISSSVISETDFKRLSLLTDIIIEKENKGVDFGAWCSILRYLDYGRTWQSLYLCNDSVFGPLIPFLEIHKKFLSRSEDIIGITDSYQAKYHIQSYFIGLKAVVLQTSHWKKFWSDMNLQNERAKVIEYHEIGLSEVLFNSGFKCFIWTDWSNKIDYKSILTKVSQSDILRPRWLNRVLYEQKDIIFDINPNSFLWKELITKCQSPFIKRELFIYTNLFEEGEIDGAWESILEQYSYPIGLIRYFLIDYFLHKDLKRHLNHFGKFKLSTGNTKTRGQSIARQINFSKTFFLFNAIESLIESSPIDSSSLQPQLYSELQNLDISYLTVKLSFSETKVINCIFIYLTTDIVELDQTSLSKIKTILKRIMNPVIVVPDKGCKAIVSSLLSLRYDGIIIEKEFINPSANRRISNIFRQIIETYEKGRFNLFERPSLADIIRDAINGRDRRGFLSTENGFSNTDIKQNDLNREFYSSSEEYQNYLTIKNKYWRIYENTPMWYKKIGQIIKVFKGNKRLVIDFKDKGEKNIYKPTAEDITHWYYLQYEILPRWYKKIGERFIKKT